jgi:hypothetical protein
MLRGIYNRSHGAGYTPEGAAQVERILDRVPDLAPIDRLRLRNGFLKYHQAVEKFMSNNSVLWDNLLFDNAAALWEGRDYGTPSALDPFVNNFSDFNWFYVSTNRVGAWAAPVLMLHRAGAYDTLSPAAMRAPTSCRYIRAWRRTCRPGRRPGGRSGTCRCAGTRKPARWA